MTYSVYSREMISTSVHPKTLGGERKRVLALVTRTTKSKLTSPKPNTEEGGV